MRHQEEIFGGKVDLVMEQITKGVGGFFLTRALKAKPWQGTVGVAIGEFPATGKGLD